METNKSTKILILPSQKEASRRVLANAFFYALGFVLLVSVLLVILFPKFFLFFVFKYHAKFFIPQAVAHLFFLKAVFSLFAMFLLFLSSYYSMVFISLRQKEIAVILNGEGISSEYGKIRRFLPWNEYKGITLTTNPLLIKLKTKKILVYDVFEVNKLRKRIEEYRSENSKT